VSARRLPFFTVLLALGISAASSGAMVPFDVQVPLVLKALTYDRNLKSRAGDQVRIAVLVSPRGRSAAANELSASLAALPERTVNGMPVVFKEVAFTDQAGLDQALGAGRWAAAYVLPGFTGDELAQIRRVCESRRVLAVAAQAEEVEGALAFGIGAQGGKPQLVVNLPNARACGTDFDLALLRLARVIQ
jgi:hypothetical protein